MSFYPPPSPSHAVCANALPLRRYALSVSGPVKTMGSYWGGFETQVAGWGFVPTDGSEYNQVCVCLARMYDIFAV